jgi:2-polyprenyl-3-methyl-5-hydroxy-6-metoxy-1,4-benzoquinol methylase
VAGDSGSMAYEQDYFHNRKYPLKQPLIRRHVLEVLQWTAKTLNIDLLNGEDKRVLDVGCAYGYTSHVLAELGYETCGVDVSAWGTKQAKSHSGSEFLVCDAQTAMPFKAGTFDLVTCFDVLEHLPHPEEALLGMFEVSKGTLVCTTPNKKVEKPLRKLMRDYDETHISAKSPSNWKSCAANLACRDLKVEAFYDLAVQFGDKLFFKSFNIPTFGLTVRIAVRK